MKNIFACFAVIVFLLVPSGGQAKSIFDLMSGPKTWDQKMEACQGGDATQCFVVGNGYRTGMGGAPARNLDLAQKYLTLGCKGGNKSACKSLYDIGFIFQRGRGDRGEKIAKDRKRAMNIWTLGCQAGHGLSCTALGSVYEKGKVVPKDMAKALELYRAGCKDRSIRGCRKVGELIQAGDPVAALEFFEKSCDWKDSWACAGAGLIYLEGRGVEQDYPVAAAYLIRSCDKAPSKNSPQGCLALGGLYEKGLGVEKDLAEAAKYYRRSCAYKRMRLAEGCFKLARAYQMGRGVKADGNAAHEYYGLACRLKLKKGCVEQHRNRCKRLNIPQSCAWLKKHGHKK
jgi:TPR repeat protein